MAWNEPGNNDKDPKDPWSSQNKQDGPPDLDEAFRSLQDKFGNIFGGGGGSGSNGKPEGSSWGGLGFIAVIAALLWLASGFYIIDASESGVVTRFGKYTETTDPGLHWHIPFPIEQVAAVDVKNTRYIEIGYMSGGPARRPQNVGSVRDEALMLTKDENYVDVSLAVQYVISSPENYLFKVENPTTTLKEVVQSAEREVVGTSSMDFVLTEGRSEVVAAIEKESQRLLDLYQSGIQITSVNLQEAQPPEQVQAAFQDVVKAREDRERVINEAQAYANEVLPRSRGQAAKQLQQAEAYLATVVAEATGKSSRFEQLLTEYQRAPAVTRERLYLEGMERVLGATNTVVMDVKGGNNLMYLPLDQMVNKSARTAAKAKNYKNIAPRTQSRASAPAVQDIRQSSRERTGRVR